MAQTATPIRQPAGPYGAWYENAIDLQALKRAHKPYYAERSRISVDGNTAAAIPFLQWWRTPIVAGFPITPATKWLEHLAAEIASGKFDIGEGPSKKRTKRVKQLESEHAAADYITGVAASCRGIITGTATSSVGLEHMTESVHSLGASGLGNVVLVNVCRATANYPLCIEGDPSDTFAIRDSGFIQILCRGKQQIYDTLLQAPAIGMHPDVMTPTMPAYYGIKDSHRNGQLTIEPDEALNAFLDEALALGESRGMPKHADILDPGRSGPVIPPGLLDGDTSMGNCVTSAWFQGFKVGQKERIQRALTVIPQVSKLFQERFGRPGIEFFERFGMDDKPEVVLVCMGPDAGTATHMLNGLREELKTRVGLLVLRVLTPFPSAQLAEALQGVKAVGVVNQAHHHGRGHVTLDVVDALASSGNPPPVESFFCGMGGADVSVDTWKRMARITVDAASRGKATRRWHLLHDGEELSEN